jgi:hypothetical protein
MRLPGLVEADVEAAVASVPGALLTHMQVHFTDQEFLVELQVAVKPTIVTVRVYQGHKR